VVFISLTSIFPLAIACQSFFLLLAEALHFLLCHQPMEINTTNTAVKLPEQRSSTLVSQHQQPVLEFTTIAPSFAHSSSAPSPSNIAAPTAVTNTALPANKTITKLSNNAQPMQVVPRKMTRGYWWIELWSRNSQISLDQEKHTPKNGTSARSRRTLDARRARPCLFSILAPAANALCTTTFITTPPFFALKNQKNTATQPPIQLMTPVSFFLNLIHFIFKLITTTRQGECSPSGFFSIATASQIASTDFEPESNFYPCYVYSYQEARAFESYSSCLHAISPQNSLCWHHSTRRSKYVLF
jgi:hypothetical protein